MAAFKKVAVLKGGPGAEREVSLRSGAAVAEGLRAGGLEVVELDVKGLDFQVPEGVEAVFPVLHGEFGEDGVAQSRLEELGLPYVGSRSWEMIRSFDKEITHALLAQAGVPMPEWEMVGPGGEPTLEVPMVIKAPRQGSSIGVELVFEADQVSEALARVRRYDDRVLVERFVPGRECTVGFMDQTPLPIVEICPAEGAYDYQAKYERSDTRYVCPADLPPELAARVTEVAVASYGQLGGRHLGRVDVRLTPEGEVAVLELNPLPGFTATSLLPKAAAATGLSFSDFCVHLIHLAE